MRWNPWILPFILVAASLRAEEASSVLRVEDHDPLVRIVDRLAERWARFDEEFVRIIADDAAMVSPDTRAQLDDFVRTTMDRLGIDAARREVLRARPIVYLLCSRPEDVRLFTGVDAAGVALLRQRIIVTHYFPHEHELVHMLAALAVEAPGGARPVLVANELVLQEGLAGYLGGRRGMSSLALRQTAEIEMRRLPIDPSRFFEPVAETLRRTHDDFFYAGATRFVEFLIEEWGMPRFLDLYRTLACTQDELMRRPTRVVLLQIEGHYRMRWPQIRQRFNGWRLAHRPGGPELCERPDRGPDFALALDARSVEFWEHGSEWVMHVEAEDGYPEVLLRFGESLAANARDASLGAEGDVRRYSLRLQPDRVELRDLVQERLLTHGLLREQMIEDTEPPQSFTVRVPREQLQGFGIRDQLWMWAAPRLRVPALTAASDSTR